MIDLESENRIAVPTGGISCTYVFPSFTDLREEIETFLRRRGETSDADILKPITEARIRFFDRNVIRTEGLPVRSKGEDGQQVLKELSDTVGWKSRIPPQVKVAAAALFDILPEGRVTIEASEVFGDPTRLILDTGFGSASFVFPPLDDAAFQKALKALMTDRLRQSGARLKDRTHEVRKRFFATCQDVGGYSANEKDQIPPHHVAAVCRWFENQEALSEAELGE